MYHCIQHRVSKQLSSKANKGVSMDASTDPDDGAMDPALREVICAVTTNLTKVSVDKLEPVSQLLQVHQERL